MKALKAALEGLEVVDPYAEIERSIGDLTELADYAEENSGGIAGVSMESVFKSFKETDFQLMGRAAEFKFAMEEVSLGVWAIIAAAAVAIIALLKKFYDWAFGDSKPNSANPTGSVSGTVDKVVKNKAATKKQREINAKLRDLMKEENIEVKEILEAMATMKNKVAKEEMSTNVQQLTGGRMYIGSMDDVLAMYIKEDADQNPDYQFVLVRRDAFSEDLLNNGPYSKMATDIIGLVQNGQFSPARNKELQDELEKLMKNENSTAEDFKAFNEKLGEFDKISVGGLGSGHNTVSDLINAAKKSHQELLGKFTEGRESMDTLLGKLEHQLEGATWSHMKQATEAVQKIIKESEEHYNHFHIEASVRGHQESVAHREGQDDAAAKHHAMGVTMKHMSKFSRNICELSRVIFVYSKGILKIMQHLRNAGLLSVRMFIDYILPKVKNPESKERLVGLAKELKASLHAYSI